MISSLAITDSAILWRLLNQDEDFDNAQQILISLPLMISNKDFNWNRKILTGVYRNWTPLCVLSIMGTSSTLDALLVLSDRHRIDWEFKFTKHAPTREETTPLKELMRRYTYSRIYLWGIPLFQEIRGNDDYQKKSRAAFINIIEGALIEYAAVRPALEKDDSSRYLFEMHYIAYHTFSFIQKVAKEDNAINDIVQAIYEYKKWLIKCDVKEIYINETIYCKISGRNHVWSTLFHLALENTSVKTVNLSTYDGCEWLSFEKTNVETIILKNLKNLCILPEIINDSKVNKIQIPDICWWGVDTQSFLYAINHVTLNTLVTVDIKLNPELSATINTGILEYFKKWKSLVIENSSLLPDLAQIVLEYSKTPPMPYFEVKKKQEQNIASIFSEKLKIAESKRDFDEFWV